MTDLPEKKQTLKKIYNCTVTCGSCSHTWAITTHIGDNLKTGCPECGRKYELGDVASTYFWSGGDRKLREDDWPPVAAIQTTVVPPDGKWYERPAIHFPARSRQQPEGGGK